MSAHRVYRGWAGRLSLVSAGVGQTCEARLVIRADSGQLHRVSFGVTAAAIATAATVTQALPAGEVVSSLLVGGGSAFYYGAMYGRLALVDAQDPNSVEFGVLAGGYLGSEPVVGAPAGVAVGPGPHGAHPRNVGLTLPAAGAEINTDTGPWTFVAVTGAKVELTTEAGAGNRSVTLKLNPGGDAGFQITSLTPQGPGVAWTYLYNDLGYSPGTAIWGLPMPRLALPRGSGVGTLTTGMLGGDQYTDARLYGLAYLDV